MQVSGLNTGSNIELKKDNPCAILVTKLFASSRCALTNRSMSTCAFSCDAASPVDAILDKEEYTLEELLDEDELIQECKSLNARLTAFLKQRESVEKLVSSHFDCFDRMFFVTIAIIQSCKFYVSLLCSGVVPR